MKPGLRQHQLRVFYRDYAHDATVLSTGPEWLAVNRIVSLAERILVAEDSFLGVIDGNDVILQCYLADRPGAVTLELLYPDATGCLRLTLPKAGAFDLLDELPELFDGSLLSGAQYID